MPRPGGLLNELERLRSAPGPGAARRKVELLEALGRAALPGAPEVARFHDLLLFLRAYPDDRRVLEGASKRLAAFARRADLARHREALAGSGIAGTAMRYRFFAPTALWLAQRFGDRLRVDWEALETGDALDAWLGLLATDSESPALDGLALTPRAWVRRLKGPRESDAAFLLRRFATVLPEPRAREIVLDGLDLPLILEPGPRTPSRTRAVLPAGRPAWFRGAQRIDARQFADATRRPPRAVRDAGRQAERIVDLARGMMVSMQRDLDVFSYGDPRDVRIADCGGGLRFAFVGFVPERRLLIECLYGYVILQNGVPIGYGTVASLFGSSEVAFNVSPAFRGGGAALVFARLLASTRALFGSDTFSLDPYQLGEDNDEAIASGAWWFYAKLGFLPREAQALRLARRELARAARDPAYRSSPGTLRQLARAPVFLHLARRRRDVLGRLALERVGEAVTRRLAGDAGADRERGLRASALAATTICGLGARRGLAAPERRAWERWAPIVTVLPGVRRWPVADRRSLVDVIRAKGGRRESVFVARFDAHRRLRDAILQLVRGSR